MTASYRDCTDFLLRLGVDTIGHTHKTYLGHLLAVYRLLKEEGCAEDVCLAGMFHSIYGTERFRGFTLALERRDEVRGLIGERAEWLAYLNCVMDRASLDSELGRHAELYHIRDRVAGIEVALACQDFDDLCRVHFFDWVEQIARLGEWQYRRAAYAMMADRLGGTARAAYDRTIRLETEETQPA